MPLDTARYPIAPDEQLALLIEAYGDGGPGRVDEVLKAVCRARGLIPTRPQPNMMRAAPIAVAGHAAPRRPLRTPGEVLAHLFMAPAGLSGKRLAAELGVPRSRVTDILHGARGITAKTALLLGGRFGNAPEFWLRLQMYHDLALARRAPAPPPCAPSRTGLRPPAPPAE